jgi:hypothetical protein
MHLSVQGIRAPSGTLFVRLDISPNDFHQLYPSLGLVYDWGWNICSPFIFVFARRYGVAWGLFRPGFTISAYLDSNFICNVEFQNESLHS